MKEVCKKLILLQQMKTLKANRQIKLLKIGMMAICLLLALSTSVLAVEIGSVRTDIERGADYDSWVYTSPDVLGNKVLVPWNGYSSSAVTPYFSLVNSDGSVNLSPGISISPRTNDNSDTVLYKGLSDGNILVYWYSQSAGTGLTDTYFKIVNQNGGDVVAATKINSAAGELNRSTECAELSNGDLAFVWATGGSNYALRRFSISGSTATAVDAMQISVTDLSGTAGYSQYTHRIAANKDGRFMIVMSSYKDNNYRGMIFDNTSPTPVQVGGQNAFIISSSEETSGADNIIYIKTLSNGKFMTVYRKTTSANSSGRSIYFKMYNADGTIYLNETMIRPIYSWGAINEPVALNGGFFLYYTYDDLTNPVTYFEYYDNGGNFVGNYSSSLPTLNAQYAFFSYFKDVDGNLSFVINDIDYVDASRTDYDTWLLRVAANPAITDVSPSGGPTAGGTNITITGSNLTGATGVTIGGTAATNVTVVDDTTITATTPAGTAGAKDVAVTTSGGSGTGTGLFTYYTAPTVTGISPTGGPTAGGTSVTITGTNFTGAIGVTIGGAAATGVTVVNATTITAATPAGTAGAKDVAVTTAGGTGTGTGLFTYVAAPAAATDAAGGITSAGATLNGTVNANNASTTVTFEYGLTTGYGSTVTADQSPISGNGDTPVSKTITGLEPNTTYHYRVKGVNAGGTTYGLDGTFTTLQLAAAPTASTATNADGTIKKDAAVTLSSDAGATIYYTTAVNSAPAVPDTSSSSVANGGAITLPTLTYGDVLNIKAIAMAAGKADSTAADLSYTVQSQTALTLTGITLSDKEYDGTTGAVADFTGAGLNGIIGTDSVSLSGTPSASFLTKTAEDGKMVTVSGYSLSGPDAEYYTLNSTLTATANIAKKALTLGTIVIADKEYDGNTTATVTSISISDGIVGSDDVSVDVPLASAAYDDGAGIGTGKAVSVSGIQLTGADSANYSVPATAAAAGNIAARTVSIDSVTITSKAYDGNTTATITGATLTGKVGAEDVFIDYTTTPAVAAFDSAQPGNGKTVSVTGLVLGGADKANYTLASGSFTTTGDITALGTVATPAASVADNTVVKSGVTVTLTTAGYDGATLYYTAGLAPENPTSSDASVTSGGIVAITGDPGEEIILKVYGTKPGYADSALAIFHYTIQPKNTLIVTGASASSKDYDGTTNAAVTGGILAGSILTGDDVTLDTSAAVGQFTDKIVGTDKLVTVGGYTLTGADAQYYDLIQPVLDADILPKDITVSNIEISDKVWDGSTTADISNITLSWQAVGDEVYARAAAAEFSDAGIGSSKIVSVTGLELAGADAGNYHLTSISASTTGNIVPAGTVAAPSANPASDNILSGTSVTLATTTAGADIHYTLDGSEPTGSSRIYTGPINLTGDPGTVITIKAIAVKTGMTDSGTLTKQYTIAEPGSLIITATPDNEKITLSWDAIPDAVAYLVYDSENVYVGDGTSVTDSIYGYTASGLTNGTPYTFTVKALDAEWRVTHSAQASATPRTVPGVPTGVTAAAGNGQATISFTAPADNGGSDITGYIVTSSPGGITANGATGPITVTGLTNGTEYTFTVTAVNIAGNGPASSASNAVTPHAPSSGGSHSNNNTTNTGTTTGTTTSTTELIINGQVQNAGTTTTTTVENQTVTTITVDDKKIEEKLNAEGNNATVVIPVTKNSDVVVGELNGQTVKNMETKEAVLEIKTENVTYTVPASQINIDNVSAQIGQQVELKDIKVSITIAAPPQDTVRIVEDTANKNNYQVVVKPVEFNITCTSGSKTVDVSKFNGYVERMVAIPDGVDPSKITTGIVLNADGTFSHVPTTIVVIDGKYYAKISSLTNSTYSVIWNPKTFKDVENHWAKAAVNDMGSRLVISGVGDSKFEPNRAVTRAEFAAIVVKSLGLMRPGTGKNTFKDVTKDAWYYDAVSIASQYGIISGYGSGKFGPNDRITREQAMTMIARAMKITGLKVDLTAGEAGKLIAGFGDEDESAAYAVSSIAVCVKTGIVSGRNGNMIAPKDNITRAEVAVIVRSLLQKSGLI